MLDDVSLSVDTDDLNTDNLVPAGPRRVLRDRMTQRVPLKQALQTLKCFRNDPEELCENTDVRIIWT